LHLPLIQCPHHALSDPKIRTTLLINLNTALKGKWLKVGNKNSIADLEFGQSKKTGDCEQRAEKIYNGYNN
jgi:hypothetical protein